MLNGVIRVTDPLNVTRSVMVCQNCKATCEPKDRARFMRRHPAKCNQVQAKRDFSKKLAAGVRCVDAAESDAHIGRLEDHECHD